MTELPLPAGDLRHALGAWRSWLAGHGSGLVPVADPTSFQWAGWWIAVVQTSGSDRTGAQQADAEQADVTEAATLAFGTPPGIVLSPQDPTLLGRATADLPITAAYAVASLDPVLRTAPATQGRPRFLRADGHLCRHGHRPGRRCAGRPREGPASA